MDMYQPGHNVSPGPLLYFSQLARASISRPEFRASGFGRSVATLRNHAHCGRMKMSSLQKPQQPNAAMGTDQQRQDAEQLWQFGYNQELHRTMSMFSNFAVTF